MVRSTKADKARQLNAAHRLLERNTELSEAAQSLSREFGLSRRQAYRYLEQAAELGQPGAGRGSLDPDHAEASAEHRARVALVCSQKRLDARGDRDARTESVSERSTKAWLRDVQDVSRFKSISTIRLIACALRSSPRSMSSWCPRGERVARHACEEGGRS